MVASSSESQERIDSRWNLFMESPPARLPTGFPVDGRRLVRQLTIAAGTAALVYLVAALLLGIVSAG